MAKKQIEIGDFVSAKPIKGSGYVQGVYVRTVRGDVAVIENEQGTFECRKDNLLALDERTVVMQSTRDCLARIRRKIGLAG